MVDEHEADSNEEDENDIQPIDLTNSLIYPPKT